MSERRPARSLNEALENARRRILRLSTAAHGAIGSVVIEPAVALTVVKEIREHLHEIHLDVIDGIDISECAYEGDDAVRPEPPPNPSVTDDLLASLRTADAALRFHPNGDTRPDEDVEAARAAIRRARAPSEQQNEPAEAGK